MTVLFIEAASLVHAMALSGKNGGSVPPTPQTTLAGYRHLPHEITTTTAR